MTLYSLSFLSPVLAWNSPERFDLVSPSVAMSIKSGHGPRGVLVVVEGLDRSGKSSQCQMLHDTLLRRGVLVRYIKFPGMFCGDCSEGASLIYLDRTTPTGQLIHKYLTGQAQQDDHSIHLLFSANRWELAESIRSDVEKGVTVIIDRYSYSGAVYSAAKNNPRLPLEWAWQPEIGLPRPDVCIFLDIAPEMAAARGGFGDERYETNDMQSRVRQLFPYLFSRLTDDRPRVINAGKPKEIVAQDVHDLVLDCVRNIGPSTILATLAGLS